MLPIQKLWDDLFQEINGPQGLYKQRFSSENVPSILHIVSWYFSPIQWENYITLNQTNLFSRHVHGIHFESQHTRRHIVGLEVLSSLAFMVRGKTLADKGYALPIPRHVAWANLFDIVPVLRQRVNKEHTKTRNKSALTVYEEAPCKSFFTLIRCEKGFCNPSCF